MKIKRKCDLCWIWYEADERDLNRGWGLCCSKSCAAKNRERKETKTKRGVIMQIKREPEDFVTRKPPFDVAIKRSGDDTLWGIGQRIWDELPSRITISEYLIRANGIMDVGIKGILTGRKVVWWVGTTIFTPAVREAIRKHFTENKEEVINE